VSLKLGSLCKRGHKNRRTLAEGEKGGRKGAKRKIAGDDARHFDQSAARRCGSALREKGGGGGRKGETDLEKLPMIEPPVRIILARRS